jgi:hypothetical protein
MIVRIEAIQQFLVSVAGQMFLPAAVRHRWHQHGSGHNVAARGIGPETSAEKLEQESTARRVTRTT